VYLIEVPYTALPDLKSEAIIYVRLCQQWPRASSFTRFLHHTQWYTTVSRTPLDKWLARHGDL